MKKMVFMLLVLVSIELLAVPCEAKPFFSRVAQLKNKALREAKRSGQKIKEFFFGKKGAKKNIESQELLLANSVDNALNVRDGLEATEKNDKKNTWEQQLEVLLVQRDALHLINDKEHIKQLTENIRHPKRMLLELTKYVMGSTSSQNEVSIFKDFINQVQQEQKELDIINAKMKKLLEDVKKYDKNNKEMIVRLHQEVHKTLVLQSESEIAILILEEAGIAGS